MVSLEAVVIAVVVVVVASVDLKLQHVGSGMFSSEGVGFLPTREAEAEEEVPICRCDDDAAPDADAYSMKNSLISNRSR